MPSGITHIFLVRAFLNEPTNFEDITIKMMLDSGRYFMQTGAVGPDLPYASDLDYDVFSSDTDTADLLHYNQTNQIPLKAFLTLKQKQYSLSVRELRLAFSFFLGYASHVIADGIMHPFIRDKVGDYAQNKTAHRVLEMNLDVVVVHDHFKNIYPPIELNFTNVHDELLNIADLENLENRFVFSLFKDLINSTYQKSYKESDVTGWIKSLHRMLGVAEGDHPDFYRKYCGKKGIAFKNYDDLMKEFKNDLSPVLKLNKPVDRADNFLHKSSIHFIDDCIPQFNKVFKAFSKKAYNYIYNDGDPLTEADLPGIDLDTGRLVSNNRLEEVPALWS